MKVLIGCEISGIVREAFLARGHDAWSCDLQPAIDRTNRHIIGDVREVMLWGWDLLAVMHPPCTRLCNSGVRWLKEPPGKLSDTYPEADREAYALMDRDQRLAFMWASLEAGAELFSACWNAPIERVCIENPVMHGHARQRIRNYQDAAQFVQPWWFGDPFFKATGLYLRNLPALTATNRLTPPRPKTKRHKQWSRVHRMPPGAGRGQARSEFFPGAAAAMADQWGGLMPERMAA